MIWQLYTVAVIFTAYISSCWCQTFNTDRLLSAINSDRNGTVITSAELDNFFLKISGQENVSRCEFIDQMVSQYAGNATRVSVLFDVMQQADGDSLAKSEWTSALQGGTVADVRNKISELEGQVDLVLAAPYKYTNKPHWYKYTDFQLENLVKYFNADGNDVIDRLEVSSAMRKMDKHYDYGVRRCYFVNHMTSYSQHSVTANKLYDVVFAYRDITWADVDSDFLLKLADDNNDNTVTKQEFMDFFNVQNLEAAGLIVKTGVTFDGQGDSAGLAKCLSVFWLLAMVVVVRFV
ncbi:uncharacterized protein LOC131951011 [Physella acuta]|uniref:uncharacterized protein LOC131951011 n=1 Tax=Physella acuta TaxID=109671 RepID=UPI0027DB159F|nr:uncharacterized protein LOC131951011 [Physella acuta]XP_059169242.1 uncharacterized protein LOC131951011 [Physella acuta]XP_059169243.1 uncharacterized protein LOC131951011 [Physella acuta]XP_059169244.1 uncharacterized protein LOC131951011 [Physella acuta]XP_059169245.1 uncharacterized protein LOC131951011 [Physella acuta]XP_059169246.1 uncharacterized protein LOC131951011 [Physella acuta]XP_059169247.1 uncharacterized protein LOC131951011 [Physella acuta]XP_059169248.1 uncharacterized p